jgi:hypothetical protein
MILNARKDTYGERKAKTKNLFQQMRRIESADRHGNVACVSCGRVMPWEGGEAQGGHYIPATKSVTVFTPENVNPQCVHCNYHSLTSTSEQQYRIWMVAEHGEEFVAELEASRFGNRKYTVEEMVDLRIECSEKIKLYRKRLAGGEKPKND